MTDPRDTDPLYVDEPDHPRDGYSYSGCECARCEDIRAHRAPDIRASARRERKVLDNRRSVFLIDRLSREPRRRQQKRKRGAR